MADTVIAPSATSAPVAPMNDNSQVDLNSQADAAVSTVMSGGAETRPTMQSSVARAISTNPDTEAELRRVAQRTGVPLQTVQSQPDEMKNKAVLNDINFDDYQKMYPQSALALSDVELAKVAHDDLANMGQHEGILKSLGTNYALSASRMYAGVRAQVGDLIGDKRMTQSALDDIRTANDLSKEVTPEFTTWLGRETYAATSGLVNSAPALLATAINPLLAVAGFGVQSETTAYGKYRERGGTPTEAGIGAGAEGAIAVATSFLPVKFLSDKLGKVGTGAFLTGLLARDLPAMEAQTIANSIVDTAVANPKTSWTDWAKQLPENIGSAAISAIVTAGTMTGVHGTVKYAKDAPVRAAAKQSAIDQARAAQAEQDGAHFDNLNAVAAESKLKERDPLAFQNFIEQVAQTDGHIENVYADPRALAQAGISIEELAKVSPSIADQAAVAMETGADLKIPVSEYATHLAGSELGQAMVDHLKTDPLSMSRAEAKEFMKGHAEKLQAQVEKVMGEQTQDDTFQQSADVVRGDLFNKLSTAKRFTDDVNNQYATLLSNFYKVQAARLGTTPEALYAQHPVDINSVIDKGSTLDQGARDDAFKNWFGNSKVKDENGEPLTVYHATTKDFEAFKPGGNKPKMSGPAIWTTPNAEVQNAAHNINYAPGPKAGKFNEGTRVLPLNVKMERPLIVDDTTREWASELYGKDFPHLLTEETVKTLKKDGYDGVMLHDRATGKLDEVIVFDPTQIKSVHNQGTYDPNDPNILRQDNIKTDAFGKWFEGSKVVDEDGAPLKVFHGSTHDITEFNTTKANPESDLGAGIYFSNNPDDIAHNYAGEGPDLTQRIEQRAEQLTDKLEDQFQEKGRKKVLQSLNRSMKDLAFVSDRFAKMDDRTVAYEAAKILARKELSGEAPNSIPVYLSIKNPVEIGGRNETVLKYEEGFDPETEEYTGEESGTLLDFVEALRTVGNDFHDHDMDSTISAVMDRAVSDGGEITASELMAVLKQSDGLMHATDDSGNLVSNEIIRRAFERAGFDGYIDHTVNQKFGTEKKIGVPMKGMDEETVHYVVFSPEQIKSVHNEGTFDPNNPNILKQGEEARGSFNPDTSTITLLQNADLSTFLHESGHFFLETMNKLALDENAPDAIKQDMQTTLDWLGVKDLAEWNGHDLEWQRDKHEQFARGFEAYLFEGKSPSIEMRGVFQRFRAWMLNVYRHLSALNVHLTDEVRGVFDRMLATTDQIKETETARSFEPMFSEMRAAGMTPEEWQNYQELGLQATQDAITDLEGRSLRDMKFLSNAKSRALKDLQREAAGRRREVRDQVTKEVMSEPVNQARRFFTKGEFEIPENANKEIKRQFTEAGVGSTKLSLPALKEMYGEEANAPWRYFSTGKHGEVGTEGIHPDQAAEMFGFSSGDELVRALLSAEKPRDKIAGVTDQRMLEKYGDLTNPDVLARAADEAVHNDARARFVATELNALQKATGGRKILAEAARTFAEGMISRLRVRDISPSRYSAAESRAAKAAAESLKAGGLAAAAVEKRNQLIQNYAAKAAHAAVAEVERAVRYFKKFDKAGSRENIARSSLDQIDGLLERFDLRKGQSLKAIDKRASMMEWKAAQEDIGLEPEIPPELLNEAMRKHYKDMTVEELRGLRDTVKQIEHIGRLKNKLLTAKDKREFQVVVDGMVKSITDNAGGRVVDNRTRANKLGALGRLFKGFIAQHRKMASLARELDGFQDAGPVWETLIRSMNESGDKEAGMRERATKDLSKIVGPILEGEKMGGKGRFFSSIGKSLNREERIGMALNMGNEGNRQRLLDGEGWTPQQLKPVLDTLTKADWDFVQNVWDFFEKFRPEIGAKEKRVYGKEPNWVEPSPVQTIHGEYRGGYYPIKYDTRQSIGAEQHSDAEFAKQQMKGAYVSATTRRSFTKARADEVKGRPLLYAMDGLYSGVNEIIHDLSWHEWLIDANRLLKNKALDNAIRTGYGADVKRQFTDAVKDIAGGEMPTGTSFEKGIADLRGGAVVAGIGFNIVNTFINVTGITNSIVRTGPKWVAMGVAQFAAHPIETVQMVNEKSEFMRLRSKTMLREVNEIQNQVRGKSRVRAVMDTMMFAPLTYTQIAVDTPAWYGAYQKALTEGHPEDRAVALADQAVLDAQSGGQVKDLAKIQRGGNLQKLFTTFYGYFNAAYNLGAEKTNATNFKDPVSVMHLGGTYLMLSVVPALMGSLINNVLTGGKDDWKAEKIGKKVVNDQISYMMGMMVGLREITGAVQTVAGSNPYTSSYGGPAGLRFFQELYNLANQIHQGKADDGLRKSVINTAGILFKLPAAQINRTIDGIEALIDGKSQNPLALVAGAPKK